MPNFEFDPENAAQIVLIQRVESRVDQAITEGQTPAINRVAAYQELVEASRSILRRAPREFVYAAAQDGSSDVETIQKATHTVIPVPEDFLRFVRIKLARWDQAIDELIPTDTDAYRLLQNPFTGADHAHPKAALAPHFRNGVKQAVECYPKDTSTYPVDLFAYVPDTAPEDVPDELLDAVLWDAAGRVLQSEKEQGAGMAFDAATKAVQGLRYGLTGEDNPSQ